MTGLSARDLRAVLNFVGEVNEAEGVAEFRVHLLDALRRLVPAHYISFNELEEDGRVLAALASPEIPEHLLDAWGRHALENPLVQRYARTRDGRPYRFSDVISQHELRKLALYRELFVPLGLRHQIAFALPSRPGFVRGIALSRGGRDFTDRERARLDAARPYLVQAFRNAAVRERLNRVAAGLSAALDELDHPAVVVDGSSRILYSTPEGEDVLDGLGIRDHGMLPKRLERIGLDGAQPQLIPLPQAPMLARPIRVPGRQERVIVLEQGQAPNPGDLTGFGLTTRQSEVLREFMLGRSPTQAAQTLGISVRTVHKHTEHINARLGTRDRAQAVATALAALRTGA